MRDWSRGTGEIDALYGRAVEAFRTAESTVPGWDETKRMILTGHQREHTMIPNDKNTTTVWTRKPALISAFSFIILIAFFAVPFSQTTEIGARLVFELSEPGGELQQLDFAGILDDPSYGIDQWNTSISLDNEDGPLVIDLLLITEDPGAPGAVLAALTAEYPVLATAEIYDPVTGTFSETAPLSVARLQHTATLLPNGGVLITGGTILTGALLSAEVYSPVD